MNIILKKQKTKVTASMEWDVFWEKLVSEKKLTYLIKELDEVNSSNPDFVSTEDLCHKVFDDYAEWKNKCECVRTGIVNEFKDFNDVHLHSSRIKSMESLIEKVIRKRYEWQFSKDNDYSHIGVVNYKDILTDIVGIRLIINYRGKWESIHNRIMCLFPLCSEFDYSREYSRVPLIKDRVQSEMPKVYHAQGDETDAYEHAGLIPKQHPMNYRSIHYTVNYQGAYVEIQMRTIYDEAWSDANHMYVYKHEDNASHDALKQMSAILSNLTNISSDLSDQMCITYQEESMKSDAEMWEAPEATIDAVDNMIVRLSNTNKQLQDFRDRLRDNKNHVSHRKKGMQ